MIFIKGHGAHVAGTGKRGRLAQQSMASACGFTETEDAPSPADARLGRFDYFFPEASSTPHGPDIAARLDRLGAAMVDDHPEEDFNSEMPAIFTYLGQFIDHDITAGTDRETDFSIIDVQDDALAQRDKGAVRAQIANLRTGSLDLDSVYGGAVTTGAFAQRLQEAMRWPQDRAKMRIGTSVTANNQPECRPRLPEDPATDLLRVSTVISASSGQIPAGAFQALSGDLAERFLDETGAVIPTRAIIGDMRNDENLAVAQTHLMVLRLHNKIVDVSAAHGVAQADREAVYDWARQQTRWIYQWLVMNVYLPTICDTAVLSDVLSGAAPVYTAFKDRVGGGAGAPLPLPLEFSVAAFRFGHTQARAEYDWNAIFGRGETACNPSADRAAFNLLFQFTGEGNPPMFGQDKLPKNWICDMERFLNVGAERFSDRNTRKLDTFIAPPLHDMAHMPPGAFRAVMQNLPIRNLRRGHLLNVPSAQSCIAALAGQGVQIAPLTEAELCSGRTGEALRTGGFVKATPLWFYVLKEAEMRANGLHLGPLGSRLVAETLAGLIVHGQDSYWTQPGSDRGRWHPRDGARPGGLVVDSLPAMMRAVGYM